MLMNRIRIACSIVLLSIGSAYCQSVLPGTMDTTSYFSFYSHYWLNMHHMLYNHALVFAENDFETAVPDSIRSQLQPGEVDTYKRVLSYYEDNIIQGDLRTGDYNYYFKRWVIDLDWDAPLPEVESFSDHVVNLNAFADIYSRIFWEAHNAQNKKVLADNIELIRRSERAFVNELQNACREEWQEEKIRVDITFRSKRDIPFTTIQPTTHIVMDSKQSNLVEGEWFELLLHESSHHLIHTSTGFVGGTILDVAQGMGVEAPRQFWHSYLFYFSGRVAQGLLQSEGVDDYELYMVRKQVFRVYFPYLDRYLPKYLDGELGLAEATGLILSDFYDDR